MCRALGVGAMFLLLPLFAAAQQPLQSGFWKGRLQIHQFNFSFGTRTQGKKTDVQRGVDIWKYEYELYQNANGIAREELKSLNRNRSVELPLDIRIMNYGRGTGFVFDRGGKEAITGPFVPVAGRALGSRRILGFECEGKEYEWTTFQHAAVRLQTWTARNSSFKVPLLQVEYFNDDTGALLALTIQMVSELEAVPDLPPSLFQIPQDLHVVKVPTVR